MYINLSDSYRLASKLTLKRLNNAWQVYSSFQKARKTGLPEIKGMPISISVEPTTACNLRCPECPSGLRSFTRPTGNLDPALFYSMIDEIGDTLSYLIFYFQGEPYLHRELHDMIRYASDRGIYTATSTNAHFLDEETALKTVESGLDRLIISIDGATQETYESYRKTGKLEKVLEGTRNVMNARKTLGKKHPHILWQFLVVRPNEHEIPAIKELAKSYGVDQLGFKTAQIYDYQYGNELIPTIEKYARYHQLDNGEYAIKNTLNNECWKMWHSCVITWDGRVVPCCFDKDAHHVLGNTTENSFSEIWQSHAYQNFRGTLLQSRDQIEMCKNCTEGTKVWA